ncbi:MULTISPECIES: BTAD domain-containing putative transcriptional regulator [unclassified Micromonospora]|uniref:AfsR/SARP family transcriptional regulator n=1 Tax=unclassified Micromonospora TaxID=2617518 RepID=UPI00331EC602
MWQSTGALRLGTPKQRTVLAMLAVQPGRLVTTDELVDELWADDPPRSAVPNVRTYAATLRRILGVTEEGGPFVDRSGGGYRLDLAPDRVDVIRFGTEYDEARNLVTAGNLDAAEARLCRAVARWRGPMLGGLPLGPVLTARVAAAEEERLLAGELLAEVRIAAGRPEQAIPLLREHIAVNPLRESAHLLLMRALRRHGDLAGAIAAYQAAADTLRQELGVGPGPGLQRLYQAMRHNAPADESQVIGVPGARPTSVGQPAARPATSPGEQRGARDWLPRSVADFVGRREVVARLIEETRRLRAHTSPVHVIDGMAGSGKTTLAVHVARRLAGDHPDAQLFVDLCGHGDRSPVDPASALVTLLRQLGVPDGRMPADADQRAELWRRELAARRAVVVLDNAADSRQVTPLLPTAGGSVVLVTSRRRLTGLDVGPPASLSVMSLQEGLALLSVSAGTQRVAEEPEAAAEVVRRCGYLPLAIRLAGSRLAHRPARRLADLARRLADDVPALGHLAVGDRTVAAAFAASYEPLGREAKRVFRLLGIHAGHHSVDMVAALSGLPPGTAGRLLDELVDCHLVEESDGARYRLHDLVRLYARQQSLASDGSELRSAATARLLDFGLHATLRAADELHAAVDVRTEIDVGEPARPDLVDAMEDRGVAWLEEERENLVSLVGLAAEHGHHSYTWKLARVLWRFCYIRRYFDDILSTHTLGLTAAELLGDRRAVMFMSNYLASALAKTGSYRQAIIHLDRAVALCRETGDRVQLVKFRGNLSVVHWFAGNFRESAELCLEDIRESRFQEGSISMGLPNLGIALTSLGLYEEAMRVHRQHLFQGRVAGDHFHVANALSHLASVRVRIGQWSQATRLLRSSLVLYARTGHRYGEVEARNVLGIAYRGLGLFDEARLQHTLALELAADSGERHAECGALNDLGLTLARAGERAEAAEAHQRALALATRIAQPYEQARALAGLAEHHADNDLAEARRHWERALAIFRRMDVPERFEVECRLAETGARPAGRG